jgi:hypothetical protein
LGIKEMIVGKIASEPFFENMMKVRVFQHKFDALVDTGANMSSLSKDALNKIRTTQQIKTYSSMINEVKIADGAKITAIASANLPIKSETNTIYDQISQYLKP